MSLSHNEHLLKAQLMSGADTRRRRNRNCIPTTPAALPHSHSSAAAAGLEALDAILEARSQTAIKMAAAATRSITGGGSNRSAPPTVRTPYSKPLCALVLTPPPSSALFLLVSSSFMTVIFLDPHCPFTLRLRSAHRQTEAVQPSARILCRPARECYHPTFL